MILAYVLRLSRAVYSSSSGGKVGLRKNSFSHGDDDPTPRLDVCSVANGSQDSKVLRTSCRQAQGHALKFIVTLCPGLPKRRMRVEAADLVAARRLCRLQHDNSDLSTSLHGLKSPGLSGFGEEGDCGTRRTVTPFLPPTGRLAAGLCWMWGASLAQVWNLV